MKTTELTTITKKFFNLENNYTSLINWLKSIEQLIMLDKENTYNFQNKSIFQKIEFYCYYGLKGINISFAEKYNLLNINIIDNPIYNYNNFKSAINKIIFNDNLSFEEFVEIKIRFKLEDNRIKNL
jgi:hypothetical protein